MATFSIQYKQLFKIEILHHYFLDRGAVSFYNLEEEVKARQLNRYNFQIIFDVKPTDETIGKLNGHGLLLKKANTGFAVWAKIEDGDRKPFIQLDDNLFLTFLLCIKDPIFHNYTNISLDDMHKPLWLSNRKPDDAPSNFPLLDKIDKDNPIDNKFTLPDAVDAGYNCFGVVRIYMKGDKAGLHITDADGKIISPERKFDLIFKNRSTYWRYVFKKEQEVKAADDLELENGNKKLLVSKKLHPLTNSGFISLKLNDTELPNPGASLIKLSQPADKIFSEIYM